MSADQLILKGLKETWTNIAQPETFDGLSLDWAGRRSAYHTTLRDRQDGRYLPVYDNEQDLRAIRQSSWLLVQRVPMARSIINGLKNYTISQGFDWQVTHPSPRYQNLCQAILKAFVASSKWQDAIERDSFESEVVDGEFLAEIVVEGSDISIEPLHGDNLTEPANAGQLEDWLGIYEPTSWSFGIAKRVNRFKPKRYHVIRNQAGTDFDCLPPERFLHWTRNIPITAARGFSDFYILHRYLSRADKVVENTAIGAAIQAAIAFIVEHAEGATKSAVESIVDGLKNVSMRPDTLGTTGRTKEYVPGTRVEIPHGARYHASLLGSNGSEIYISVMEALLRLTAATYHFPEHMITGYAGNNNMASSLVAESPFVQGRIADQHVRGSRVRDMFIKVLAAFCSSRWARARGYDWEDIRPGLEILVKNPSIITRDPGTLTTALLAQIAGGLRSKRGASQELNIDYEAEQESIAEETGRTPGAPQPGADLPDVGRRTFKRHLGNTNEITELYGTGQIDRPRAEIMLGTLGLAPENAKTILDAVEGKMDGTVSEAFLESIIESVVDQWKKYP